MRISRTCLENHVTMLNQALGLPVEPWSTANGRNVAHIGNLHLDHNIGGWRVEQMINEGGGITCPLGEYRLTAFECFICLRGALGALSLAKGVEQ